METTIICWGNIGIMEKKMETTITVKIRLWYHNWLIGSGLLPMLMIQG